MKKAKIVKKLTVAPKVASKVAKGAASVMSKLKKYK